jgi:hypothetical protein
MPGGYKYGNLALQVGVGSTADDLDLSKNYCCEIQRSEYQMQSGRVS